MRRKAKFMLILGIFALSIGFATVATTLYMTGNVTVGSNADEFNVKFTDILSTNCDIATIMNNGKDIYFNTNNLQKKNDSVYIKYEVTNMSRNYDAEVDVVFNFMYDDDFEIDYLEESNLVSVIDLEDWDDGENKIIRSGEAGTGYIMITLNDVLASEDPLELWLSISVVANAVERTELGDEVIEPQLKMTGVSLYDEDDNLLCDEDTCGIDIYAYEKMDINAIAAYAISDNYPTATKIVVSNTATKIPKHAFGGCFGVKEIVLPTSITLIDDEAFYMCFNLENINIPDSVTKIGYQAFIGCGELTTINIPNSVITIEDEAFMGCTGLVNLSLGNSLEKIGRNAFYLCGEIDSITIPASVNEIIENPFASMNVSDYIVENGNEYYKTIDGVLFNIDETELIAYPRIKYKSTYNVPNTTTKIADNAFYLAYIENINLPDSVTNIGELSFYGTLFSKNVYVDSSNENYKDINGILYSKNGDTLIYYPVNKINYTFTIPDHVLSISPYAFNNNGFIKNLVIPNNVTQIGNNAFEDTKLESVSIGSSITSIPENAFYGSDKLTTVNLSEGLVNIESSAFQNCESLGNITIPSSVKFIGSYAFRNAKLTSATFMNTENWYYGSNKTSANDALSSTDMDNPSTAATYLKNTYYYKVFVNKTN